MNHTIYNVVTNQLTGPIAVTAGTQWSTQIEFATSGGAMWPVEEPWITPEEETRLREENTFVKDAWDQYQVALILAHGDD